MSSYSKVVMILLIFFGVFGTAIQKLLGVAYAGMIDDAVMLFVILTTMALLCAGRIYKINSITAFFVFFLISTVISFLINSVPMDVYLVQMRSYMLPLFIVFIFSKLEVSDSTIKLFVDVIMWITITLFLSAIIELFIGRPILYEYNRFGDKINFDNGVRVFSLVGNPIDFSNFIILALFVVFSGMRSGLVSLNKGRVLIVLCILSLLLSASRGPIIATVFTYFLYFMHRGVRLNSLLKWGLLSVPLLLLLGNKLLARFSDISIKYFSDDQYRTFYLIKSYEILKEYLLFGVGPGRFGGWVSINYHESEVYTLYDIDTKGVSSIDMFWPHFLPEVGLIGFGLFLYPFIKLFKVSRKAVSENNNTEVFLSTCVQLMFPAVFLVGLFSISLETQFFSSIISILCGLFIKVVYDKGRVYSLSPR